MPSKKKSSADSVLKTADPVTKNAAPNKPIPPTAHTKSTPTNTGKEKSYKHRGKIIASKKLIIATSSISAVLIGGGVATPLIINSQKADPKEDKNDIELPGEGGEETDGGGGDERPEEIETIDELVTAINTSSNLDLLDAFTEEGEEMPSTEKVVTKFGDIVSEMSQYLNIATVDLNDLVSKLVDLKIINSDFTNLSNNHKDKFNDLELVNTDKIAFNFINNLPGSTPKNLLEDRFRTKPTSDIGN